MGFNERGEWNGFCDSPRHPHTTIPHIHEGTNGTWCIECGRPLQDDIHHPVLVEACQTGRIDVLEMVRRVVVLRYDNKRGGAA